MPDLTVRNVIDQVFRAQAVRDLFESIVTGVEGAIDFLRTNFHVESIKNLPYSTLIVPLCAFFADRPDKSIQLSNDQRKTLLQWFW